MRAVGLSTTDNPFNPITEFDDWYRFDTDHNYDCCSKLMRIAMTDDFLPDVENEAEIEQAIDRIVNLGLVFVGDKGQPVYFMKFICDLKENELYD